MRIKWIGFLICIIFCIGCSKAKEGEWKGSIENENGVEVVLNPEIPMYSSQLVKFEEDLVIGQSQSGEEAGLSSIMNFAVDDQENIYILDTKPLRIKVFDKDGKFLRSFGQAGQGPGDLTVTGSMQITHEKEMMFVDDMKGEIKFFSTEGRFLRSLKCPALRWVSHTTWMPSGRIYSVKLYPGSHEEQLISLSFPYEESTVVASRPAPRQFSLPVIWIRYAAMPDNHLIWGITSEYEFSIINDSGKTVRKIRKKHTPLPLSEEYKAEISQLAPPGVSKESYAKDVAERLRPHFPAFDFFFTDETGRLFVKTFATEKVTGHYLVDVFDTRSRFLARAPLKVDHVVTGRWPNLYKIKNNCLYAPEHDENGFPVLKRYEIIWERDSFTPRF